MKKVLTIATVFAFGVLASARAADVKENWEKQCAKCHGPDGKADTKMGKKLEVRDLTDPKIQAAFTDAQATTAIKDGVKVEDKSKMPGYADKLNDEEIKALVAYVRSLKKG
jgi:mono/diheme cytochrome c family protein